MGKLRKLSGFIQPKRSSRNLSPGTSMVSLDDETDLKERNIIIHITINK